MIEVLPLGFWGLVHHVTAPLLLSDESKDRKANGSLESRAMAVMLRNDCEPLLLEWGCAISANLVSRIAYKLSQDEEVYMSTAYVADMESLRETIHGELGRRRFAYISPTCAPYFERDRLFGDDVYDFFPEARTDIKDAGNCIAASLHTAAVFHAMRVAERGLVWLAAQMEVELRDKGIEIEITEATWNKILGPLKTRINEARAAASSSTKRAELERYAKAADQCEYMKDIWRNAVSHAHKAYDEAEAISCVNRVCDFMQSLARLANPA